MRVIVNNIIPFPGFDAVNLFGIVFARKGWEDYSPEYRAMVLNHEAIHTAQGRELLWIGFYVIYFIEWLARLVINGRTAYEKMSFEREAYQNEREPDYLKTRKHFAQWRKLS